MGQLSIFGGEDEGGRSRQSRGISLAEARDRFFAAIENPEGTHCPCCGKYGKLYKRKLTTGMALALVWMVRRFEQTGEWIFMPREAPRRVVESNQHPTLKHWGLVEKKENGDSSRRSSGFWRPTAKGVAFARGQIRVPLYIFEYYDVPCDFSPETISIREVSDFDYEELMR